MRNSYLGQMAARLQADAAPVVPPHQPNFSPRIAPLASDRTLARQAVPPSSDAAPRSSSPSVAARSVALAQPPTPLDVPLTDERPTPGRDSVLWPRRASTAVVQAPANSPALRHSEARAARAPDAQPAATSQVESPPRDGARADRDAASMWPESVVINRRSGRGALAATADERPVDRVSRGETARMMEPPATLRRLDPEARSPEPAGRSAVAVRGEPTESARASLTDGRQVRPRGPGERSKRADDGPVSVLRPALSEGRVAPRESQKQSHDLTAPAESPPPPARTVEIGSIDVVVTPPPPSPVIAAPMPPAAVRQLAHGFSSGIGLRQS